ncbi:heavy metal translocating P-type ATPase [Halanaerobium sp. Z-7514]|uniref:Copper-exporting P-type ATPase n=1 Tax=Halanaerobium polyolivorans TaxID=2886943 RepID=A0AAW4X0V4_9FIRM|nr:heavy metal translocating P-type ATPase [Halanaerobium polyolivorans]MCC3145415.1 heavy metal translocating P-type ATPase [Halanaerobium polyolivorans]
MSEKKLTFSVTGMSCASCAQSVEKALKNTEAIVEANVNINTEKATVKFKENKISLAEIEKIIIDSGYGTKKDKLELPIKGMSCTACAQAIEKNIKKLDGILEVNINFATEKGHVEYLADLTKKKDIVKAVEEAGYEVESEEISGSEAKAGEENMEMEKARKKLIYAFVLTIPVFILMFGSLLGYSLAVPNFVQALIEAALAFPVVFILGYQTHKGAFNSVKHGGANMDVLITLGTFSAYAYGVSSFFFDLDRFFGLAAGIMAFHLLGKYLESKAKGKASQAIKKLMELGADTARIITAEQEKMIPVEEVEVGDIMLVKPGEKIPTDGQVIGGKSAVDESMATGESMPVKKLEGDEVIGGTINKQGVLKVKASKVGEDTFLSQVIKMVEEAQGSKVPIQAFADKVTSYFVPTVIALAILTFVAWIIVGGTQAITTAVFASIAVLVIACPCALGLATPTALMVGTGKGAENGVLIRDGEAVQTMKDITAVVLDKTGTITKGEAEVTDIIAAGEFDENKVLELAGSAEKSSEHPLAEAIVKKAEAKNIEFMETKDFNAVVGRGIEAVLKDKVILVGNQKFMESKEIDIQELKDKIISLEEEAKTAMIVAYAGQAIGIIAVADTIKKDSVKAIKAFKAMGLKTIMITGDNSRTARAIADQVGIESVISEILPEDKSNEVKKLQSQGEVVAMVGDGINDAPALKQANVGIAIGTGTDIAIESSDLTLVSGELSSVVSGLKLSRYTFATIKQNLFWAFIYNTIAIPIAALGFLNPIIAAGAMTISSISVILNSSRLKNKDISLS